LRPKTKNSLTSLAAVTPNGEETLAYSNQKKKTRSTLPLLCSMLLHHACMRDAIPLRYANLFEKTEDHRKGWAWTGKAGVAGQIK
jgi:hypothetical protein